MMSMRIMKRDGSSTDTNMRKLSMKIGSILTSGMIMTILVKVMMMNRTKNRITALQLNQIKIKTKIRKKDLPEIQTRQICNNPKHDNLLTKIPIPTKQKRLDLGFSKLMNLEICNKLALDSSL